MDNVISTLFNKQSANKSGLAASDFPDLHGKHAPAHKMSESTKKSITDHIESYHLSVSLYRSAHAFELRRCI